MTCFFYFDDGSFAGPAQYRVNGEITFDTGNYKCNTQIQYFYSLQECFNANKGSWFEDACERCMHGTSNEFAQIDGDEGGGGIVFSYDEENDFTDCDIDLNKPKEVSCAQGWYGKPEFDNGYALMGCSRCPANGSEYGITNVNFDGKETFITSCYLPHTKQRTDEKGTYKYSEDCYYTK